MNGYGYYTYKGWTISDRGEHSHPVTGRWQAHRHGIRIGTTTEEGLRFMIDLREKHSQEQRHGQDDS